MKEFEKCFKGKSVLVTDHTGFKGSWLSTWLLELGASVPFSERLALGKTLREQYFEPTNEVTMRVFLELPETRS